MPKVYTVEVSPKKLFEASDMLRYDGAYRIKCDLALNVCEISLVSFTPNRWRSFDVEPKLKYDTTVTQKAREELLSQAEGFINGLKFCQSKLMQSEEGERRRKYLVEDYNPDIR